MHTESGAEKQTTIAMGWQAARETMPPVPRKTYDKHKIKAPLRTKIEFDKVDVAFQRMGMQLNVLYS